MLHFTYHSTRCFFLKSAHSERYLAIDAGWPCTLYEYARNMKTIGCRIESLKWVFVTHFHMDHAGLVGEFLERGITCYQFENQLETIDAMERTIRKNYKDYVGIDKTKLVLCSSRESRELLEGLGFNGEAIITDYHSPDSISFLAGDGDAVVGDLPPESQGMPDDQPLHDCWDRLRARGAKRILPSHGAVFEL